MNNVQEYRIDKVLATQKEIGPVVPDGGYGWFILLGSIFYYVSIPSISIAYGLFMMYKSLETTDEMKLQFWDSPIINAPLYFVIFWTIMDPISHKIVMNSKWPRLVILCSICLVCSGILCFWLGMIYSHHITKFIYKTGGTLTGCGASLVLTQIDRIISQYFRLKLYKVKSVLIIFRMLGFIILPVVLGNNIRSKGLTHVIGWYHLFLISGTILCFVFKKPNYLKNRRYQNLRVHNNVDDEEDIFTKSCTELRIARENTNVISNEREASTSGTCIAKNNEVTKEWVAFDDEDYPKNELEIPKELFSGLQINNNTTYSFDNSETLSPIEHEDLSIFVSPPKDETSKFKFLRHCNFYLSTFQMFVNKSSEFVFYTIYPTHLYYSNQDLHPKEIERILAYIFIGSLLTLIFLRVKEFQQSHKKILITTFSWMTCFGYFMCTDLDFMRLKFLGGVLIASSLISLIYVSHIYYQITSKNQQDCSFITMYLIVGVCLCIFMVFDFTNRNCMRGIGLLQFANGSIWFCAYILEKIKRIP